MNSPQELQEHARDYKFVAVLNKEIAHPGVIMNALAHMSAGLVASADDLVKKKMSFINLQDQSGQVHPSVSALSLIVLRGTGGDIVRLKQQATTSNIHHVDFLESMTGDTYREQVIRTANLPAADLCYYGIIMFGEKEILSPITKKFSLWR